MDELLLRSILVALAVSLSASVAGTLTVFRRASFLVAGAAHSALAGAAIAIFLNSTGLNVHYFPLSLAFATLAALLASQSARKGDINTGIAISFALSMSVAVLALSATREYAARAWQLFFGDLLLLTQEDVVITAVSTSLLLVTAAMMMHKFIFVSFDPEGAEAAGINVTAIDSVLIALISLSVVSALKAIGAVLVFALFIAPSAAAREIAGGVAGTFYLSFIFAITALVAGIAASFTIAVPAGSFAALIVSVLYFLLALKRRG